MTLPIPKKRTIGLTGGIASGKSAVARILKERGVGVVDADQLAREVVAIGSEGLRQVVQTFGSGVLSESGALDREKLAAIVFSDQQARTKLQAITHPRIAQLSAERLMALQQTSSPYLVYEAPLLVETGAHKGFDGLIAVAVSEDVQIRRVVQRDSLSEEAARKRIAAQLPLARKIEVADYVIYNEGSLADLERKTSTVHEQILEDIVTREERD